MVDDEASQQLRAMWQDVLDEMDRTVVSYEEARREALAEPLARIRRLLDMATRDAGGRITPLIQAVDNLAGLLEMPIALPTRPWASESSESSTLATEEIEERG